MPVPISELARSDPLSVEANANFTVTLIALCRAVTVKDDE